MLIYFILLTKKSFLDDLPGGIILSALRFSMTPKQVKVVIPGVKKKLHIEMINQAIALGPLDEDIINNIKDEHYMILKQQTNFIIICMNLPYLKYYQ